MNKIFYIIVSLVIIFSLWSCENNRDKNKIDYKFIYKKLIESDDYHKFKDFNIIPREKNSDIYEFDINKLKLTLFITYKGDKIELNDYSKKALNDTLYSKYGDNSFGHKKVILNKASDLISLFKKYDLLAVNSVQLIADSTKWFVDFMLKNDGSLRYGNYFDSLFYNHNKNKIVKLNSMWIYLPKEYN